MSHAGGPARLEAHIASKRVRAANGAALEVLRDVSLTVMPGRLTALVGPSGCGKTTFLKCIAGLDTDFDGTVKLPQTARIRPHPIGMVFQEPRLLPWRTVEDNIRLPARQSLPSNQASTGEIERILNLLHLAEHRQHFPGELSLGLARRVALARAFAVDPDVLLLDEPFVSLDQPLALELRGALKALLARRPIAAILVTHDAVEAAELADDILVLSPRPATISAHIAVTASRDTRTPSDIAAAAQRIRSALALANPATNRQPPAGQH